MRDKSSLWRAWLLLVVMSAVSAGLTTQSVAALPIVPGLALLGLAFGKTSVILADYLGLRRSPAWRRGFTVVLSMFLLAIAALYFAGLS